MSKERVRNYLENSAKLAAFGFVLQTSLFAFTRGRRKEILHRDGCQCVHCGATTNLEASHIDHSKDDSYNEIWRGRTEDTRCHYMFHLNYRDFPEDIGLSVEYNDMAIKSLFSRMPKKWRDSIPMPDCDDDELRNWNVLLYGDEDYFFNLEKTGGIPVDDWPTEQLELPNFAITYKSKKRI